MRTRNACARSGWPRRRAARRRPRRIRGGFPGCPRRGPGVGRAPEAPRGGKTSAASKRAREPAAPARASRRLRGIDVSGEPSATPVRAVSYAEQASDTTQHKRRGLAFPDPASSPARRSPRRSRCVRSASPCTRSGTCTAARSRAGTGPAPAACSTTRTPSAAGTATKHHFGEPWRMTVETGEVGPVFRVTNVRTGARSSGRRPPRSRGPRCARASRRERASAGRCSSGSPIR